MRAWNIAAANWRNGVARENVKICVDCLMRVSFCRYYSAIVVGAGVSKGLTCLAGTQFPLALANYRNFPRPPLCQEFTQNMAQVTPRLVLKG